MDRIAKTPGICGGSARVAGARLPVWVIVNMRESGWTDEEIMRAWSRLTPEDMLAAREYAESHAEEIEREMCEQRRLGFRR